MDRIRIALVSLPWSERCRPTMALAVLGSYLRQEVPDCDITSSTPTSNLPTHLATRCTTTSPGTIPTPWAVVQGEGELPLVAIMQAMARGDRGAIDDLRGVVTQATSPRLPMGASLWELRDIDALPLPDFDAYAEAVGGEFDWDLAIEGSRGCWWDRMRKTGRAELTCQFCNFQCAVGSLPGEVGG